MSITNETIQELAIRYRSGKVKWDQLDSDSKDLLRYDAVRRGEIDIKTLNDVGRAKFNTIDRILNPQVTAPTNMTFQDQTTSGTAPVWQRRMELDKKPVAPIPGPTIDLGTGSTQAPAPSTGGGYAAVQQMLNSLSGGVPGQPSDAVTPMAPQATGYRPPTMSIPKLEQPKAQTSPSPLPEATFKPMNEPGSGMTDEEFDKLFKSNAWDPVFSSQALPALVKKQLKWAAEGKRGEEPMSVASKGVAALAGGVGDVRGSIAGAVRWMTDDEYGKETAELARQTSIRYTMPESLGVDIVRTLPFAIALIPASIAAVLAMQTGAGIPLLATAAGKIILGTATAWGLGKGIEGTFEGGATYNDARAQGKSNEESAKAAKQVWGDNFWKLGVFDALEFLFSFVPMGKGGVGIAKKLASSAAGRAAVNVGRLGATAVSEGAEEMLQEWFQYKALGGSDDFWTFMKSPEARRAGTVGAIFGAGMGGAGAAYRSVQLKLEQNIIDRLPADIQEQVTQLTSRLEREGASDADIETAVMEFVSGTYPGRRAISEATIEMVEQIGEMERSGADPVAVAKKIVPGFESLESYNDRGAVAQTSATAPEPPAVVDVPQVATPPAVETPAPPVAEAPPVQTTTPEAPPVVPTVEEPPIVSTAPPTSTEVAPEKIGPFKVGQVITDKDGDFQFKVLETFDDGSVSVQQITGAKGAIIEPRDPYRIGVAGLERMGAKAVAEAQPAPPAPPTAEAPPVTPPVAPAAQAPVTTETPTEIAPEEGESPSMDVIRANYTEGIVADNYDMFMALADMVDMFDIDSIPDLAGGSDAAHKAFRKAINDADILKAAKLAMKHGMRVVHPVQDGYDEVSEFYPKTKKTEGDVVGEATQSGTDTEVSLAARQGDTDLRQEAQSGTDRGAVSLPSQGGEPARTGQATQITEFYGQEYFPEDIGTQLLDMLNSMEDEAKRYHELYKPPIVWLSVDDAEYGNMSDELRTAVAFASFGRYIVIPEESWYSVSVKVLEHEITHVAQDHMTNEQTDMIMSKIRAEGKRIMWYIVDTNASRSAMENMNVTQANALQTAKRAIDKIRAAAYKATTQADRDNIGFEAIRFPPSGIATVADLAGLGRLNDQYLSLLLAETVAADLNKSLGKQYGVKELMAYNTANTNRSNVTLRNIGIGSARQLTSVSPQSAAMRDAIFQARRQPLSADVRLISDQTLSPKAQTELDIEFAKEVADGSIQHALKMAQRYGMELINSRGEALEVYDAIDSWSETQNTLYIDANEKPSLTKAARKKAQTRGFDRKVLADFRTMVAENYVQLKVEHNLPTYELDYSTSEVVLRFPHPNAVSQTVVKGLRAAGFDWDAKQRRWSAPANATMAGLATDIAGVDEPANNKVFESEFYKKEQAIVRKAFDTEMDAIIEQDDALMFQRIAEGDVPLKPNPSESGEYHPELTSVNQIPGGMRVAVERGLIEEGQFHLDYGGGEFDTATRYLSDNGIDSVVYDKYARNEKHNSDALEAVWDAGGADVTGMYNVLNVIESEVERREALLNAFELTKPGGKILITVYEKDGTGIGQRLYTKDGRYSFQANRKTADYQAELEGVFGKEARIQRKGKVYIVTKADYAGRANPVEASAEQVAQDIKDTGPEPNSIERVQVDVLDRLPKQMVIPNRAYIIQLYDLAKNLSSTARYAKLQRGVLGAFYHQASGAGGEKIELYSIRAIFTTAHEVGHALDWRLNNSNYPSSIKGRFPNAPTSEKVFRDELKAVSQLMRPVAGGPAMFDAYRRRHQELMADFIAAYLLDPELTESLAPHSVAALGDLLDNNQKIKEQVRAVLTEREVVADPDAGLVHQTITDAIGKGVDVNKLMDRALYAPSTREDTTLPSLKKSLVWLSNKLSGQPTNAVRPRYLDAVQDLIITSARLKTYNVTMARKQANEWREKIGNDRLESLGAAVEGIDNLKTGESVADIMASLTPEELEILKEYRYFTELSREGINTLLEGIHGPEYVKFLENYLLHVYENPKAIRAFVGKWQKNVVSAVQRKFPTLKEAVDAGLVPKTQNIATLYQAWAQINYNSALNQVLVAALKDLVNTDGKPILMKPADAPANWKIIDHPAIQKVYGHKDEKTNTYVMWRGGVAVDPDAYMYLHTVFDTPFEHPAFRAIETFNLWQKATQLFVGFFHPWNLTESFIATSFRASNPIRGLVAFGGEAETLRTGWRIPGTKKYLTTAQRIGKKLLEDNDFLQDLIMHGLQISPIEDAHVHRVIAGLEAAEQKTRNIFGVNHALKGIVAFKKFYDKKLWNEFHAYGKADAYFTLVREALAHAPNNIDQLEVDRIKERCAELINDAIGGQEWETKYWASPKVKQALHIAMLAPDYSMSNFNIARKAIDPRYLKDPTARRILSHYWVGMLLMLGAVMSAVNKGVNDKWLWENEVGRRTSMDVTPIVHFTQKLRGTYDPENKRHYYAAPGKQVREVLRYLNDPLAQLLAKASPLVHNVAEQMFSVQAGQAGWVMPWVEEEMDFYESLPLRLKAVVENFKPFSLSGTSFAMTMTMNRGMGWWQAQRAYEDLIRAEVDPTWYGKLIGRKDYDRIKTDLDAAAELNGLVAFDMFKQANSKVRGDYYSRFWEAVNDQDWEAADRVARILIQIGVTPATLKSSSTSRKIPVETYYKGLESYAKMRNKTTGPTLFDKATK